jgi:hypothetical protein
MARETGQAMLMMASSPAPDSASSVTSVWRLSGTRGLEPIRVRFESDASFCRSRETRLS